MAQARREFAKLPMFGGFQYSTAIPESQLHLSERREMMQAWADYLDQLDSALGAGRCRHLWPDAYRRRFIPCGMERCERRGQVVLLDCR